MMLCPLDQGGLPKVMNGATPPRLFTIERAGPGRLHTMSRPDGGDRLGSQMRGLAQAGVDVLVSLLTDDETSDAGLDQEASAAQLAGLEFRRLPTSDMSVPERAGTLALAASLRSRLSEGAGVAVHCFAGIGRSSTLAAAVMVLEGLAPAEIWDRISAARGLRVPETAAQREFIDTLRRPPAS
jgi:protein tyrosine phosphatase (PTP) superfamily phosphohydrolase (DUF442 family)